MVLPKIPLKVIIVCIIFAIIGGLWGAHASGLIDLKPILADLPFIGDNFKTVQTQTGETVSPLEEENKTLKQEVSALETEKSNLQTKLQADSADYEKMISDLEGQVQDLKDKVQILEAKETKANKLAEYYGEMKPKNIVPIFDNLDDELVISILMKLKSDQTADILAEINPQRAAKLTKLLTDISMDNAK